jgi:hypothetical protein
VSLRPQQQRVNYECGFGGAMAATLDRISKGRLLINVVTGGDPAELAGDGIFWAAARAMQLQTAFYASGVD